MDLASVGAAIWPGRNRSKTHWLKIRCNRVATKICGRGVAGVLWKYFLRLWRFWAAVLLYQPLYRSSDSKWRDT